MKYFFGHSEYNRMEINATTLQEAKEEFAFSCGDFARYSEKNAYTFCREIYKVPFGYTEDGKHTEDYSATRFYSVVNIYELRPHAIHKNHNELHRVDTITSWEIEVILAQPKTALLTHNKDVIDNNGSTLNEVAPSRGIMMLKQQGRMLQLQFRQKQLELIKIKTESALQFRQYDKQRRDMEDEQSKLNEKIRILSVYSGIGKDVVKVQSGKESTLEKITIFQSLRFIREDIELLSEYENFDFTSMDAFDDFLRKNYKQLLPCELSIQAFKISKYPILYKVQSMFGETLKENEENHKVFILVRNGDNIYRLFNQYKLNGKLFHTEEEMNAIAEMIGKFSDDEITKLQGGALNFWEIKGETENKGWTRNHKIAIDCAWYPTLDKELLNQELNRCYDKYNHEINRRKTFIEQFNLEDELNVYSWRWGMRIGRVHQEYFTSYFELFERMHKKEAFNTKNYILNGTLKNLKPYTRYTRIAEDGVAIYDDEWYEYDYADYYNRDNNATMEFNPLNGKSLNVSVVNCSHEHIKNGFFEDAKEKFLDEIQKKAGELHLLNFHTVAILQNILDNKKIFSNFNDIDFITGENMELVNRIYDSGNLLATPYNAKEKEPKELLEEIYNDSFNGLFVGKEVYCLRISETQKQYDKDNGAYLGSFTYCYDTRCGDKPFKSTPCIVEKYTKNSVRIVGLIDRHTKDKYNRTTYTHIYKGEPKEKSIVVKKEKNYRNFDFSFVTIESIALHKEEMLVLMSSRLFRENNYLDYGLFFKYLLKILYDYTKKQEGGKQ